MTSTEGSTGLGIREGVTPFDIGENSLASFDHPDGTYRVTVKDASEPITSLGEFVRTAYAVGIRADVVEMTEPGTIVGALCLGPADGEEGPAGYGFFVDPGGDYFIIGREDPSGRVEFLKEGTDERIETVQRMSIVCVPNEIDPAFGGSIDVTVIGYANGLEVATTEDPDGYHRNVYAGLTVVTEKPGTEVRFTRVRARVPERQMGALRGQRAAAPNVNARGEGLSLA